MSGSIHPGDAEELQGIVEKIRERYKPERIILYGSFAYGQPNDESDFDILVILTMPPSRKEAWDAARVFGKRRRLQLSPRGTETLIFGP